MIASPRRRVPTSPVPASIGVLLLLCLLCACGAQKLEDAGAASAKGVMRGSYDGLLQLQRDHPELRPERLLDNERLREAARGLAKATVVGAGEGYDEAKIHAKAAELSDAVVTAALASGDRALADFVQKRAPEITVLLRQTLYDSVRGAGTAASDTAKAELGDATRTLIGTAVTALGDALSSEAIQGAQRTTAVALGDTLRTASAAAVQGARSELAKPETLDAAGALGRRVAEDAATGFRAGLESDQSRVMWIVAAMLLGTLFVLSITALCLYVARYTKTSRALTIVAQQINEAGDLELKRSIRDKAVANRLEDHLSGFLKDRGL